MTSVFVTFRFLGVSNGQMDILGLCSLSFSVNLTLHPLWYGNAHLVSAWLRGILIGHWAKLLRRRLDQANRLLGSVLPYIWLNKQTTFNLKIFLWKYRQWNSCLNESGAVIRQVATQTRLTLDHTALQGTRLNWAPRWRLHRNNFAHFVNWFCFQLPSLIDSQWMVSGWISRRVNWPHEVLRQICDCYQHFADHSLDRINNTAESAQMRSLY